MTAVANEHVQRELLREAAEGGPAAIFVVGDDRRPVAVNDSACRLLGYDRAELLALDPDELSPDERFPEPAEGGGEIVLLARDGREVRVYHRTAQTRVAGLDFWVAIAVPLDASD